ncbi:guanine nucleotide exchange factor DBS-like isoform X2 [Mytilus galloprovincialis]|uniref:guanine nucleotide exchange factor DBS-like isoform X2 n=1 Tax=Mytilus galloprovincialis TaxID=29158 RepID=UPI003F7B4EA1
MTEPRIRSSKLPGIPGNQVAKIEKQIDDFLENFKRKSSILDRQTSEEYREYLGVPSLHPGYSSSQGSTEDFTDDYSPSTDKSYYLGNSLTFHRSHKRQFSNTTTTTTGTSDSEWGPDYEEDSILKDKFIVSPASDNASLPKAESDIRATGDEMGEALCPYSVLDVAPLLQSKFAFVSGGKAINGAPVLTIPENPDQKEISDEDYKKIVCYLCCVPPLHETELGFVIVIDRRNESWGDVKNLLLKINQYFPKHVQVVFLLQPKGFFQRAFSDMKTKFIKEELEYKVVLLHEPAELYEHIDIQQLTKEVGGELVYDPNEWTQHRSAVEKFCSNTEKIATAMTVLVKKYADTEIPNNMEGVEKLIHDHQMGRREMLDDLDSSVTHGQTLLQCIKGDNEHTPLIHQTHVINLQRLLVQLAETKTNFEGFWEKHESRLKYSLELRKFEDEFKLFQYTIGEKLKWLEEKLSEVGESVAQVEALFKEFEDFETDAEKDLEQADRMRSTGENLIMDDNYAVDSIRPKCIELQRMCDQYKQLVRQRREILQKSNDLQDRIDKANKWCTKGVDILANRQPEQCQTHLQAESALKEIESFMASAKELKLNNPKEFRQLFEGMMTPDTRVAVQKVLKRIEDVTGMCAKRKEALLRVVRQVHPAPKHPPPEPDPLRNSRRPNNIYEKSARVRTDVYPPHQQYISNSVGNISDTSSEKTRSSCSSMSTTVSSVSSLSENDCLLAKRRHVLNELIETEKTYVAQLEDIVQGYFQQMDNPAFRNMIPEQLIGKKDVLFGNLEQIFDFHRNVFLHELENCRDAPAKVGKCFANRKEEFHLYSIYCQNKHRSEELRNTIGDQNPFFMECQKRLGHKLPLGAYLLKPVQRITKYQLLLKEMLRFTDHDQACATQLQEALDCMLAVVRYVNDSLHQVSIVNFPGNISDQGRLLMQGSFCVFTEHHRGRIKDLRFKPMHRHVFLYEKSILLCKKKEESPTGVDKGVYVFKNLLQMVQVGLTENVKGDKKRFELWLRGREEVYIIQAPNMNCKDMWVKEIKRVLMSQFDKLKVTQKTLRQSQENLVSITDQETKYSNNLVDNWRNQHLLNNNTSTLPVGIEMRSPESPTPGNHDGAWSDEEYTSSNPDEESIGEPHSPSSHNDRYKALGDFHTSNQSELSFREGDLIEVVRAGSNGWWFAKHLTTHKEGWAPSNYLEPIPRSNSQFSVSSIGSPDYSTSKSSLNSGKNSTASPINYETTI